MSLPGAADLPRRKVAGKERNSNEKEE